MKTFLLGAAVAGALISTSYAADLPMKAMPAPAAVAPIANWSGCYIGGDFGVSYQHGDGFTTTGSSGFFTIPPGITATIPGGQLASNPFRNGGGIAGVYGGCNYQMGVWVVGVEADWSSLSTTASATSTASLNSSAGPIGFAATNWTQTQNNLITARARFGYVPAWLPNTLLYATGGAAWTKINTVLNQPGTAFSESQSDTMTGWTAGAGFEWMLPLQGWTLRAEYLHVQFPNFTTFTSPTTSAAPGLLNGYLTNLSSKVTDDIVRVGLSYKFWNWTAH